MFADIEASFKCEGIENFLGGFPNDKQFERLDVKLPMHCQKRPVVYRIRDRSSLEPLFKANGLRDALPGGGGGGVLSLPASDHLSVEPLNNLLAPYRSYEKETPLALPTPDRKELENSSLPSGGSRQIGGRIEFDSLAQPQFWSAMLYSALGLIAVVFVFFRRKGGINHLSKDLKLQNVTPKKRKNRKNNKNGTVVGEKLEDISQSGETTKRYDSYDTSTTGRKIGKLIVTNKQIAKGSNGTIVLEGNYEGRSVAVKRLVRTHHSVAVKEIQNLITSDRHPNIVRWHGVEYDQDFVYLCLERCTCSLHDLISFCTSQGHVTANDRNHESPSLVLWDTQLLSTLGSNTELELWKDNGYPSATLLKLMRDVVCGLAHLHELKIIHRDLKPQNVLVIKDRAISAKISDMGISKHLDGEMSSLTNHATGSGSSGWQAPEQLRQERQTRAVDLFSLGCILFFCMTGGKHPFGESLERDVNIVNDRKDLFLIEHIPEATNLVSQLLDAKLELRPTATEVMIHPLFWDSETRLSFLRDASDRVELEDREEASQLLEALEDRGRVALGCKWDEKMENAVINDISRYRRYKFDSVRDLLRVIRNKLNHYRELSKEIQAILGSVPEGFDSYFSTRFPSLLIEVYQIFLRYCADEELFQKYFRNTRF
ncbi:hypothetical protein ACP275_03G005700 [Erythranthe tilingii]